MKNLNTAYDINITYIINKCKYISEFFDIKKFTSLQSKQKPYTIEKGHTSEMLKLPDKPPGI